MKYVAGASLALALLGGILLSARAESRRDTPENVERRALDYLRHPRWYSSLDPGEFVYSYHTCQMHSSQLVCTACYSHPKRYLGTLSVACSMEKGASCSLLLLPDELKSHGVDLAYCEKTNR